MSLLDKKIEVLLDDLAYGGDAVGRYQGRAVFVPYGLPEERAVVRVVEEHRSYLRAEVERIAAASPLRIAPRCSHFGRCGGCQWQMLDYGRQLIYKKKILQETLFRLGGVSCPEIEIIPHSSGWRYRNKAQFPVVQKETGKEIGYYLRGSHRLERLSSCPILEGPLDSTAAEVIPIIENSSLKGYDEANHRGQLRHLVLRFSRYRGRALLSLVTRNRRDSPQELVWRLSAIPGLAGIHQNINPRRGNTVLGLTWQKLWGEDHLWEEMAGLKLRLSPGSFLQVNMEVAERAYGLLERALELGGDEVVLDVYSGIGAIALSLSRCAGRVLAIEEVPSAVEDARASAQSNNIGNCCFIEGRAGEVLDTMDRAEVVVLDPPRKGVEESALAALGKLRPLKVAYLSCNPATLARDLKRLLAMDFELQRMWMLDMFPQTYHIEALAILRRR